jgi:hypothetical protein
MQNKTAGSSRVLWRGVQATGLKRSRRADPETVIVFVANQQPDALRRQQRRA